MGEEKRENWLSEFVDLWTNSGPVGKILWVLACLGASTTLTNLTSIIIEWRGLIAEMLYFYSQYIRDPIATSIKFITFDILRPSGPFIDAILLYFTYFSGEKRVIGKLNERSALNSSLFIMFVIVVPLTFLVIALTAMYFVDRYLLKGVWNYAEAVSVSIPLFMIFMSFYGGIRSLIILGRGKFPEFLVKESHQDYYRYEIGQFIKFATPLLFAFIFLAILASINLSLP